MTIDVFGGRPIDRNKRNFYAYSVLETAAAWADITTSTAVTDTPSKQFDSVYPETLKEGVLKEIEFYFDFANAVTYDLFVWRGASAGDQLSASKIIYRSADEHGAALADATRYHEDNLNIHFVLDTEATFYHGITWSGAAGNTKGRFAIFGEVTRA